MSPIPPSELREIVEGLVTEMTKRPSWSTEQRVSYAKRTHPAFCEAYPRVLDACTKVRTFADARDLRSMLGLMLAQVESIDRSEETLDSASRRVGVALGERFLPKPDAPPPSG